MPRGNKETEIRSSFMKKMLENANKSCNELKKTPTDPSLSKKRQELEKICDNIPEMLKEFDAYIAATLESGKEHPCTTVYSIIPADCFSKPDLSKTATKVFHTYVEHPIFTSDPTCPPSWLNGSISMLLEESSRLLEESSRLLKESEDIKKTIDDKIRNDAYKVKFNTNLDEERRKRGLSPLNRESDTKTTDATQEPASTAARQRQYQEAGCSVM